jgi:nucleoside-diphosphate-sugar epimerase
VVLKVENTPPHLLKPGNAAQHWAASSARIRRELGYKDPIALDEAIRRTVRWERENPPATEFIFGFDYSAEDAALAGRD